MTAVEAISLADIEAAAARLAGLVLRTPLVRLPVDPVPTPAGPAKIYLKLENLQPIGSFKLRGAGNALRLATPAQLKKGVYTASAGNMAQGVAWVARELGVPCTVIVPDHAPATKLAAIERLGGRVIKVPFADWWQVILDHAYPGQDGFFVHPVSDPAVMAGNGTIGLEILEDLPDAAAVVIPFGGGGLSSGIASALRARRPDIRVYAAEVETAAPLAAAMAAGEPETVLYQPSFVDGIGSTRVLADMWPRARALLDGSLVVTLAEIAAAIRLLAERNRIIAEGAGGAPVAAALKGLAGGGKVVCVVSGGNIDMSNLVKILGE